MPQRMLSFLEILMIGKELVLRRISGADRCNGKSATVGLFLVSILDEMHVRANNDTQPLAAFVPDLRLASTEIHELLVNTKKELSDPFLRRMRTHFISFLVLFGIFLYLLGFTLKNGDFKTVISNFMPTLSAASFHRVEELAIKKKLDCLNQTLETAECMEKVLTLVETVLDESILVS